MGHPPFMHEAPELLGILHLEACIQRHVDKMVVRMHGHDLDDWQQELSIPFVASGG